MSFLTDLKDAAIGWLDLIGNRPRAGEHFNAAPSGLRNALIWYFVVVLLTTLLQGGATGFPAAPQLLLGLAVNMLPPLGIALVVFATLRLLRSSLATGAMVVPAVYAMSFVLLIGLPLTLFGGGLVADAMLGALGYLFYRAARAIAGLGIGVSVAFAILGIVVLVALPIGLYMVIMPVLPVA